jgi:glutathione S-transferase
MEFLHDSGLPGVWPADRAARTLARCVAFEMHSGFPEVRAALSFNMGYQLLQPFPLTGKVALQIQRIEAIWRECRERFGAPSGSGPYLFGAFTAADAMYCPVAFRFFTYRITLECPVAEAYAQALRDHPAMQEWASKALTEEAEGIPAIPHYDEGIVKLGARKL